MKCFAHVGRTRQTYSSASRELVAYQIAVLKENHQIHRLRRQSSQKSYQLWLAVRIPSDNTYLFHVTCQNKTPDRSSNQSRDQSSVHSLFQLLSRSFSVLVQIHAVLHVSQRPLVRLDQAYHSQKFKQTSIV